MGERGLENEAIAPLNLSQVDRLADFSVYLYLESIGSRAIPKQEINQMRGGIEQLTYSQKRAVRRYLFDEGWGYLSQHLMNSGLKHITGSCDNDVFYTEAMLCHAAAGYFSREFLGLEAQSTMHLTVIRQVDRELHLVHG
ncbi:MAG TPA: hypothetical protein VJI52_06180 [Candidatus Nanoarchaeia archaeon]|nr:hypothetical protein [Candidatus Nanoarchaeia archaeon]